jgi:hypothetical protein
MSNLIERRYGHLDLSDTAESFAIEQRWQVRRRYGHSKAHADCSRSNDAAFLRYKQTTPASIHFGGTQLHRMDGLES